MKTMTPYALLTAAMCAACADDEAAAPPPEAIPATLPAALTLAQFQTIEANVECASLFACTPQGSDAGVAQYMGGYARCVAHTDALPGAALRRRDARLVADGVARFDADAARRCLDAQRTSPCAEPAACAEVFVGTVAVGQPCQVDEACAGDAYCSALTPAGESRCPGLCVPRIALGERCFGDFRVCSAQGLTGGVDCRFDTALSGERYPFRCIAAEAPGQAREGEICTDYRGEARVSRVCAPGLDCVTRNTAEGSYAVCSGPAALGAPCVARCQRGAVCDFDNTVFTQRCLPFVVREREGERCVQGNNGGEVCNVLLGLDCVAGRCRRVGTGAENSPCFSARFGVDSCNAGLVCSPATQTCRPRKAEGEACASGEECAVGVCVGDAAGVRRCRLALGCTPA
jgi:hypothetical protein